MLADGSLKTVSATENKDLFNLVVGGYGLFGVIVEAELDISDNLVYQTGRRVLDYKEFPALFAGEIEKDSNIGLMYGHLSTAPSTFLRELLLYTYTKRRCRFQAPAARRGQLHQTAAADHQPVQARSAVSG